MRWRAKRTIRGLLFVGLCAALGLVVVLTQGGTSSSAAPVPDRLADRALEYTYERVTIKRGEPTVLLSRAMTIQALQSAGLPVGNDPPGCAKPMHLVVVAGDFDVRGLTPASLHPSVERPADYIGYVFSTNSGNLVGIMGDRSGAMFEAILDDPALPDSEALPNPTFGATDSPHAPSGSMVADPSMPCDE